MAVFDLVSKEIVMNAVIRSAKHRMPALMNYAEAMIAKETFAETMPATAPPATTAARGQSKKVIQAPYPRDPMTCRHPVDVARRTGNAHGRFQDSLNCGTVWSGLLYQVPITKGVPVSTWAATCTRRNNQASGRRPPAEGRGVFKKLARMLLVLSALLGDYGPAGLTEEQGRLLDTFAEQQGSQRESWRGVQFRARGGRQPQELEQGGAGATGAPSGPKAGGQAASGRPSTQAGLLGGPQHPGTEGDLRGERLPVHGSVGMVSDAEMENEDEL